MTKILGLERVVETADSDDKPVNSGNHSMQKGVMQFFRRHKMFSFIAVNLGVGGAAMLAGYAVGTYLPADEILAKFSGIENVGNYPKAFTAAAASVATRLSLNLTAVPFFLYQVNRDIYSNGHSKWKEFSTRYTGFVAATLMIEGLAGVTALNILLDRNVPFNIAMLLNGKITAPVTSTFNYLLYHAMVLKSNPLPIIVEKSSSALEAAAAGTKRAAYATTAYIASHM